MWHVDVNYRPLKQAACNKELCGMLQHVSRYHWRVDERPCPDVQSSVVICGHNKPAGLTGENRLRQTILFCHMPAFRTLTRRIARVYRKYWNANASRLVFKKRTQLIESPIVQCGALLARGLNPFADVRQLFDGNSAFGALRFLHDAFGNTVVHIFLKTGLFVRYFLEFALGRARSVTLQVAATVCISAAFVLYALPTMAFPVTVKGKVDYTQVDSKYVFAIARRRHINVADTGNVPLAAHKHQINLSLAMFEKIALPVTADILDFLPSSEAPDGYNITRTESEDAVIVGLRGGWLENVQHRALAPVGIGIGDLRNAPDGRLGGESVFFFDGFISSLMQRELSEDFCFKRSLAYKITCGITNLERLLQTYKLYVCWLQLDVDNKFHISNIEYPHRKVNSNPQAKAAIPLPVKTSSFLAVVL